MRDDDDIDIDSGGGMGGWAGYMLGISAAESAQRTRSLVEAWHERRRPREVLYTEAAVIDTIDGWKAAVARRDEEIARLRQRIRELRTREPEGHAGTGSLQQQQLAEEVLARRNEVARHEHDIGLLQNTIEGLMAMHDEELAELKAEIARLKGEA
jgi:hypothetical protein